MMNLNDLCKHDERQRLAHVLRSQSWTIVQVENDAVARWRDIFAAAFRQSLEIKLSQGLLHSESDQSVGYQRDHHREFFETRLDPLSEKICPDFEAVPLYSDTVKALLQLYRSIACVVLECLADMIGADPEYFFHVSDLKAELTSPEESQQRYSSNLLRICHYFHSPDNGDDVVSFGSHTDMSLLTLGICSSICGLEIQDAESGEWQFPEREVASIVANQPADDKMVFVVVQLGEYLEVLTKHYFKASVHRVRLRGGVCGKPNESYSEQSQQQLSSDNCCDGGSIEGRISCPCLVRVLDNISIDTSLAGPHTVADCLPDLDGIKMKCVRKLLELKRQKCRRLAESRLLEQFPDLDPESLDKSVSVEADWVLRAFY